MQDPLALSNILALKKKSFALKFDLENTEYDAIETIGTGAYGVVCSAVHRQSGKRVAIKKIPRIFEQMTLAMRTYREIKILKHFNHSNIISIQEILLPKEDFSTFHDIYIVLDLMESDLHRIIYSSQELTNEHIRWFLYQILRGLKYVHSANVVHRDLKPSNLLVNGNCDLKIGDFGMARGISSVPDDVNIKMTQYVATRWYRAPEIMLQSPTYTTGVDVWSVGCILAEMIIRKPLFPGKDFRHQLQMIFDIVGTPSASYVEATHTELIKEYLIKLPKKSAVDFPKLFPNAAPKAVRLLRRFLNLDPKDRLMVDEALRDPYLSSYHDPDDEPICTPSFDFSFEKQFKDLFNKKEMQNKVLREVISDEIRSCVQQRSTTSDAGKIMGTKTDSILNQKTDSQLNIEDMQSEQLVKISDKVPVSSTLKHVKNGNLVCRDVPDIEDLTTCLTVRISQLDTVDVEMKSAKGDSKLAGSQQQQQQLDIIEDVKMLSAKLEEQCNISSVPLVFPSSDEVEHGTLIDAKAKIKAALLNAELRKQRMELGQRQKTMKPMTALQKQRQREEKRRNKQQKALEKKKKKHKEASDSPKGLVLSDEDRNLLERWQSMQKHQQLQPTNNKPSTKLLSSSLTSEDRDSNQTNTNPSLSSSPPPPPPATIPSIYSSLFSSSSRDVLTQDGLNSMAILHPHQKLSFNVQNDGRHAVHSMPHISSVGQLNQTVTVPLPPPAALPLSHPSLATVKFGERPDHHSLLPGALRTMEYSVNQPFGANVCHGSVDIGPVVWLPSSVSNDAIHQQLKLQDCLPSYNEALAAKQLDFQGLQQSDSIGTVFPVMKTTAVPYPDMLTSSVEGSEDSFNYILKRQESKGFTLSTSASVDISKIIGCQQQQQQQQQLKASNKIIEGSGQHSFLSPSKNYLTAGYKSQQTIMDQPVISGCLIEDRTGREGRGKGGGEGEEKNNELNSLLQETLNSNLDLNIITSRLTKSHVEDLALADTPRGTGFGYGVGMDIGSLICSDAVLESRGFAEWPESSPNSAALMAAWRDLMGDLNASEFETALQMEMQEMGSCITLNDFSAPLT